MIRFLLPVLLLAFGACQVPNQSNDANASQASLEVSEDCSGGDCSSKSEATAASTASECSEGQSECSSEATAIAMLVDGDGGCCADQAAAAATAAGSKEACAMKAAGVCEEGGACPMQAAGNVECSEMGSEECPMEKAKAEAAAAATAAGSKEACAMKAAGVCEEGGACPMQAAGNVECSEMGSEECPMEKAKAEAAVQASLLVAEGCCAGATVAEACGGCAEKATAASMKQCEGMDPAECESKKAECETKSECSSEKAPAAVETGATQTKIG